MPSSSRLQLHRESLPRGSRYELLVRIASGGMATVYVGRLSGAEGFRRLVAIKRAHPHLVEAPDQRRNLAREARVAARIHHPNVVAVQDIEELGGELLLVMDYVEGASLSELNRVKAASPAISPRIALRILIDAAHGLHAAHSLTDEDGRPLRLVHRDITPHNILVGTDGLARIADFGIAKSFEHTGSSRTTTGLLKGKVAYMAPEYLAAQPLDARADVFSLGVVAWETLTGRRLFRGANQLESMQNVLGVEPALLSSVVPELGTALDDVVLRALVKDPEFRWPTAQAFAEALERQSRGAELLASHPDVGEHVRAVVAEQLELRKNEIRARVRALDGAARPESPAANFSDTLDPNALQEPERTLTLAEGRSPERASSPIFHDTVPDPSLHSAESSAAAVSAAVLAPREPTGAAAVAVPMRPRRKRTALVVLGLGAAIALTAAAFFKARSAIRVPVAEATAALPSAAHEVELSPIESASAESMPSQPEEPAPSTAPATEARKKPAPIPVPNKTAQKKPAGELAAWPSGSPPPPAAPSTRVAPPNPYQ